MIQRVLRALKHLGYIASFFTDVPPFIAWLYHKGEWLLAMAAHEPIGSAALACALAVAIALAWFIARTRPRIL